MPSNGKRPATPGDGQKIADHARQHMACQDCAVAPGEPCTQPGTGRTVHKTRYIAAAIATRRQGKASRRTPEQEAEIAAALAALPQVSPEEIEACRTPAGGYSFTRDRLTAWGVPWPPPAGWRAALQRDDDDDPGGTAP